MDRGGKAFCKQHGAYLVGKVQKTLEKQMLVNKTE